MFLLKKITYKAFLFLATWWETAKAKREGREPHTLSIEMRLRIRFGFIGKKFEPLQCDKCGCRSFNQTVLTSIEGQVIDYMERCEDCDKEVAFWSCGTYMP